MKVTTKKNFFKSFFEFILNNIVLITFLILLVIDVCILKFHPFFEKDNINNREFIFRSLFLTFSTTIIGVIIGITIKKKKYLKSFKRKLFLYLHSKLNTTSSRFIFRIISNIINVFFKKELSIVKQEDLNVLVENLKKEKEIIIVYGDSYSGKSMFIEETLYNLILCDKDAKLYENIDNKISYIDFSKKFNRPLFIQKYYRGEYEKNVIIFDNFNYLSRFEINQFINSLEQTNILAKNMIFIIEDLSYFENFRYQYSTIKLEKKTNDKLYNGNLEFNKSVEKLCSHDNDISLFFSILRAKNNQFIKNDDWDCFLKIFDNEKETNVFIILMINNILLLENKIKKFWKKYIKKNNIDISLNKIKLINKLLNNISLNLNNKSCYKINKYISIKFIIIFLNNDIFNEFISCLKINDPIIKWLLSVKNTIAANTQPNKELFEQMALNYNYNFIKDILNLTISLYSNLNDYLFFLAIIEDRIEEYSDACEHYQKFFSHSLYQDISKLYYFQSNHGYDDNLKFLEEIRNTNLFFEYSKKYWKLHIDMHKGIFNYSNFKNLLDDIKNNFSYFITCESHFDIYHLLRRCYFDTIRSYYLSYINDPQEYYSLKNYTEIINFMREYNSTEFETFYHKFNLARLVHYDILQQYLYDDGLYNSCSKSYENVEFNFSIKDNIKDNIDVCLYQYKQSLSKAKQIGDRTTYSIQHNILEIELFDLLFLYKGKHINNFFESKIKIYKDYLIKCEKSQKYEYCVNACTYLIKAYFLIYYFDIDTQFDYLKYIDNYIKKTFYFIKKSTFNNNYAKVRTEVYKIFLYIIKEKEIPFELIKNLITDNNMEENSYNRELRILNLLLNEKNQISIGKLIHIIRLYPIVTQ